MTIDRGRHGEKTRTTALNGDRNAEQNVWSDRFSKRRRL